MPLHLSNKEFKEFHVKVKNKFPCKEIRVTRNKCHPKWLMLNSNSEPGMCLHRGGLFPLLASTMDSETVQRLIMSRQALPLPPDFSAVLDDMHHWGRSVNPLWCCKTLELFVVLPFDGRFRSQHIHDQAAVF